MLVLDGLPGCGKTTRLGALRRQCPNAVVFPEAQPPDEADEHTVLRALMGEDYARTQAARHLAEHEPHRPVASDRSHLGVLAYRYAHARLTGAWADFEHALTYTSVLDQRHHDDTVLILHLDPAESLRRRGGPAASSNRFWPWFDPAFLRAYGEFWHHLDQWVTPGPRWSHHHADDPTIDATLRTLLPDAPKASTPARQPRAGTCRAAATVARLSR
jgi:thymidylate kinase